MRHTFSENDRHRLYSHGVEQFLWQTNNGNYGMMLKERASPRSSAAALRDDRHRNDGQQESSTNADQEEAQEELEIDYQGDALDIGFNVTYLLDVLANLKAEKVQVSLGDSNSSALITLPDDDTFKYVVMPMRI